MDAPAERRESTGDAAGHVGDSFDSLYQPVVEDLVERAASASAMNAPGESADNSVTVTVKTNVVSDKHGDMKDNDNDDNDNDDEQNGDEFVDELDDELDGELDGDSVSASEFDGGNSNDDDSDQDDGLSSDFVESESETDETSSASSAPRRRQPVTRAKRLDVTALDPELYGLRRSGRERQAVQHYEEEVVSSSPRKRTSAVKQGKGTAAKRRRMIADSDDDDLSDSSDGSDYGRSTKRKRKTVQRKAAKTPASRRVQQRRAINSDSDEEFVDSVSYSGGTRAVGTRFSDRKASRRRKRGSDTDDDDDDDVDDQSSLSDESDFLDYSAPPIEEDTGPAVDQVVDRRVDETTGDTELLVKWKGKSHMHATWETLDTLAELKGFKKVENYLKAHAQRQNHALNDVDSGLDEGDSRDLHAQLFNDYTTVDRVIASREQVDEDGDTATQYLCLWKALSYADATWEDADVLSERFQDRIDEFLDRQQAMTVPHRSTKYRTLGDRKRAFKRLTEQPEYIVEGTLREYQLEGVSWLAYLWSTGTNGILADEMGLGKTVQTISFLRYMYHQLHIYGPFLVVVPLSVLANWAAEFQRWAPEMNLIVYIGNGASRSLIQEHEFYQAGGDRLKFNVLLTTFEYILMDANVLGDIRWSYLAIDEAHRLKNSDSQLHDTLRAFHTGNRLLITEIYHSLEDFEAPYKHIMDATDDAALSVQELQSKLKPHLLRRLKKDVEKSLPQKNEYILRCGLARSQMDLYTNLHLGNFELLRQGGNIVSLANLVMELKKASNHPFLFDGVEKWSDDPRVQLENLVRNSGKMYLLDKLLGHLKATGHRVLIFSQMVRMLDIISDYLKLKGYASQRLDGSVGNEARKRAIERFNAPGSPDFVFLLSTRAGGLGINLDTADTVIIFDSDWNPQNDLQAMARAHRIGQKNVVNIYRFIAKDTIEEQIFERAKAKMVLEHAIIGNLDATGKVSTAKSKKNVGKLGVDKEELDRILRFGAQSMFKKLDEQKKDGNDTEIQQLERMDIADFLANAERQVETTEESSANDAFLNQFKVADFGAWEDIIPKQELEQHQANEQIKKAEELGERRRTAVKSYAEDGATATTDNGTKEGRKATAKKLPASGNVLEITARDLRALIRVMMKFGYVASRYDDIAKEAGVEAKDEGAVDQAVQALITACRLAVKQAAGDKSRKSVLIEHESVPNINASSLVQRLDEMDALHNRMRSLNVRETLFRFSAPLKATGKWTVPWGSREDAMLAVGIYRHGYGNWAAMAADRELELRFHLDKDAEGEPERTPKSIHLSRRAEYLLKMISESERSNRRKLKAKSTFRKSEKSATVASGTPKGRAKSDTTATPATSKNNRTPKRESGSTATTSPLDDLKRKMAPVNEQLRSLARARTSTDVKEKLAAIKQHAGAVGNHVHQLVDRATAKGEDHARLERRLWKLVQHYWPQQPCKLETVSAVCKKVCAAGTASKVEGGATGHGGGGSIAASPTAVTRS